MENGPEKASNEARIFCLPTNPDLANILGRTDLHSDNFQLFYLVGFLIPRFLDFLTYLQIQGCQPEIAVERRRRLRSGFGPQSW